MEDAPSGSASAQPTIDARCQTRDSLDARRPVAVLVLSTTALLLAFLPLPFSGDLVDFAFDRQIPLAVKLESRFSGVTILGVGDVDTASVLTLDLVLYALIGLFTYLTARSGRPMQSSAQRVSQASRNRRKLVLLFVGSWLLDAAFIIFFEAFFTGELKHRGDVLSCFIYLIPQALIFLCIAHARGDAVRLRNSVDGPPLIAGTLLAWLITTIAWPRLMGGVEPSLVVEHGTLPALINQEYFAQMSQLLPIVLIALALELRFFGGGDRDSPIRAVTVMVFVTFGEIAALLALVRPANFELDASEQWLEYAAFVITIDAFSMALTALIWALLTFRPKPEKSGVSGDARMPERVALPAARTEGQGEAAKSLATGADSKPNAGMLTMTWRVAAVVAAVALVRGIAHRRTTPLTGLPKRGHEPRRGAAPS